MYNASNRCSCHISWVQCYQERGGADHICHIMSFLIKLLEEMKASLRSCFKQIPFEHQTPLFRTFQKSRVYCTCKNLEKILCVSKNCGSCFLPKKRYIGLWKKVPKKGKSSQFSSRHKWPMHWLVG